MVKRFNYFFDENDEDEEEKLDLLTHLFTTCLPNLEEIDTSDSISYVPVLNSLQDSQLKHLKRIDPPNKRLEKSELANYATCALFLKDRIEQISIIEVQDKHATNPSGSETSIAQLYTQRLYYNLHQFDMLESLKVERRTNDEIHDLEYILENCKSLETLTFDFDRISREDSVQNQRTSIEMIPTFLPAFNVREIRCAVTVSSDYSILLYIMHKFAQLRRLTLEVKGEGLAHLNQNLLYQWLNYLSRIRSFCVEKLPVEKNDIMNIISNYWSVTSKPGTKHLKIIYSAGDIQQNICLVDMWKNENIELSCLSLKYRASNRNSEHIRFFEKNGAYLKKLNFEFSSAHQTQRFVLPTDFASHTLTHCPNIQILHFDRCILKEYTHSRLDFRKRTSIQELYFSQCLFNSGALERLSLFFSKIKIFRISGFMSYDAVDRPPGLNISSGDADFEILMPHTDIDCVIIEAYVEYLYLKVFSVTQVGYYYYKGHDDNLEKSSEEEYTKVNTDLHVYICCKTNPTIEIE